MKGFHLTSLRDKYMSDPDIIPPSGKTKEEWVEQIVSQMERQNRNNARAYALLNPTSGVNIEGGGSDTNINMNRIRKAAAMILAKAEITEETEEELFGQAVQQAMERHSAEYAFLKADETIKPKVLKRYQFSHKGNDDTERGGYALVDHPTLPHAMLAYQSVVNPESDDPDDAEHRQAWRMIEGFHVDDRYSGSHFTGKTGISLKHVKQLEEAVSAHGGKFKSIDDKIKSSKLLQEKTKGAFNRKGGLQEWLSEESKKPASLRAKEYTDWFDHTRDLAKQVPSVTHGQGRDTASNDYARSYGTALTPKEVRNRERVNAARAKANETLSEGEEPQVMLSTRVKNGVQDWLAEEAKKAPELRAKEYTSWYDHKRAVATDSDTVMSSPDQEFFEKLAKTGDSWKLPAPVIRAINEQHHELRAFTSAHNNYLSSYIQKPTKQSSPEEMITKRYPATSGIHAAYLPFMKVLHAMGEDPNTWDDNDVTRETFDFSEAQAAIDVNAIFTADMPTDRSEGHPLTIEKIRERADTPNKSSSVIPSANRLVQEGSRENTLSLPEIISSLGEGHYPDFTPSTASPEDTVEPTTPTPAPVASPKPAPVEEAPAEAEVTPESTPVEPEEEATAEPVEDQNVPESTPDEKAFFDKVLSPFEKQFHAIFKRTDDSEPEKALFNKLQPIDQAIFLQYIAKNNTDHKDDDDEGVANKAGFDKVIAEATQIANGEGNVWDERRSDIRIDTKGNVPTKDMDTPSTPSKPAPVTSDTADVTYSKDEERALGHLDMVSGINVKQLSSNDQQIAARIYNRLNEDAERALLVGNTDKKLTPKEIKGLKTSEKAKKDRLYEVIQRGDSTELGDYAGKVLASKVPTLQEDTENAPEPKPKAVEEPTPEPQAKTARPTANPNASVEELMEHAEETFGGEFLVPDYNEGLSPERQFNREEIANKLLIDLGSSEVEFQDNNPEHSMPAVRRERLLGDIFEQYLNHDKYNVNDNASESKIYADNMRGIIDSNAIADEQQGENDAPTDTRATQPEPEPVKPDAKKSKKKRPTAGSGFKRPIEDDVQGDSGTTVGDGQEPRSGSRDASESEEPVNDQQPNGGERLPDEVEGDKPPKDEPTKIPKHKNPIHNAARAKLMEEEGEAFTNLSFGQQKKRVWQYAEEHADELTLPENVGEDESAESELGGTDSDSPSPDASAELDPETEEAAGDDEPPVGGVINPDGDVEPEEEEDPDAEFKAWYADHPEKYEAIYEQKHGNSDVYTLEDFLKDEAEDFGRSKYKQKLDERWKTVKRDVGSNVKSTKNLSGDNAKELREHLVEAEMNDPLSTMDRDMTPEEKNDWVMQHYAERPYGEHENDKKERSQKFNRHLRNFEGLQEKRQHEQETSVQKDAISREGKRVSEEIGNMATIVGADGKLSDRYDNAQAIHYLRNMNKSTWHETRKNLEKAGVDLSGIKGLRGLTSMLGVSDDIADKIISHAGAINGILSDRQKGQLIDEMNRDDYMSTAHRNQIASSHAESVARQDVYEEGMLDVAKLGKDHKIFSTAGDHREPFFSNPEMMEAQDNYDASQRLKDNRGEETREEKIKRRTSQGHPTTDSPGDDYSWHPESGRWQHRERFAAQNEHFYKHLKPGESASYNPAQELTTEHLEIGKLGAGRKAVTTTHEPSSVSTQGSTDYMTVTKTKDGKLIHSPVHEPSQNVQGHLAPEHTPYNIHDNPEMSQRLSDSETVGELNGLHASLDHKEGSAGASIMSGMRDNLIRHHRTGGKDAPRTVGTIGGRTIGTRLEGFAKNTTNFVRNNGGRIANKIADTATSAIFGVAGGVDSASNAVAAAASDVGDRAKGTAQQNEVDEDVKRNERDEADSRRRGEEAGNQVADPEATPDGEETVIDPDAPKTFKDRMGDAAAAAGRKAGDAVRSTQTAAAKVADAATDAALGTSDKVDSTLDRISGLGSALANRSDSNRYGSGNDKKMDRAARKRKSEAEGTGRTTPKAKRTDDPSLQGLHDWNERMKTERTERVENPLAASSVGGVAPDQPQNQAGDPPHIDQVDVADATGSTVTPPAAEGIDTPVKPRGQSKPTSTKTSEPKNPTQP